MHFRHITISGEPGSGKSSVGRELARIYGMDIVSTGALQRELAASLGVSLLDVNKRAELDQSIDLRIDSIPQGKGAQTTSLIFDSRLAWHFVPNAFKLHLIVDPTVAAERLHRTRESSVGGATACDKQNVAQISGWTGLVFRSRSTGSTSTDRPCSISLGALPVNSTIRRHTHENQKGRKSLAIFRARNRSPVVRPSPEPPGDTQNRNIPRPAPPYDP